MQVLAETMVDLKERMQDQQHAGLQRLVNKVTAGLGRFVDRSSADVDSLDEATLTRLLDEAEGLENQWHDLEQQFDAKTRRGEQVQRELVTARYRAHFVGLKHEVERWQQIAEQASRLDRESIAKSLIGLRADLSDLEAKIRVFEAAHLDGWRGLRRGLQRAAQRLEKKVKRFGEPSTRSRIARGQRG